LKPLSVTLPFAARFTDWGDSKPCAGAHSKNLAKAKTVTAAEVQEGDAGAVFDLAPVLGLVSDQRAANGGVMAGVKTGVDRQPNFVLPGRDTKTPSANSDGVFVSRMVPQIILRCYW
jgi:hypothetical protein